MDGWRVERAAGGATVVRGGDSQRATMHHISPMTGLDCSVNAEGTRIEIHSAPARSRLLVLSWTGPTGSAAMAAIRLEQQARALSATPLSALATGGPTQLGTLFVVRGKLNADPEASGTEYEIDDVPLPVGDQPPYTPMTLSGLAFAEDGTAYACTLVGDVWKITGLHGDLRDVHWKRYATGLALPLGIQVIKGIPHVTTERFTRSEIPGAGDAGRDLQRDAAGNFYSNTGAGIWRISPDGKKRTFFRRFQAHFRLQARVARVIVLSARAVAGKARGREQVGRPRPDAQSRFWTRSYIPPLTILHTRDCCSPIHDPGLPLNHLQSADARRCLVHPGACRRAAQPDRFPCRGSQPWPRRT